MISLSRIADTRLSFADSDYEPQNAAIYKDFVK